MRRTAIALLTAASALSCTVAQPSPGVTTSTASPSAQQSEFATLAPTAEATNIASATVDGFPEFDHVYLIVMENREYGSIVGNPDAPYINSLIASYGLATNYDAIGHPSEPNYIALFAGSTLGVTSDGRYDLAADNLADQVDAAGKSWHVYEQDYPGECSAAASAQAGSI